MIDFPLLDERSNFEFILQYIRIVLPKIPSFAYYQGYRQNSKYIFIQKTIYNKNK